MLCDMCGGDFDLVHPSVCFEDMFVGAWWRLWRPDVSWREGVVLYIIDRVLNVYSFSF